MKDSEKLEALEEALKADTTCSVKLVKTVKHLEMLTHVSLAFSSISLGMLIGILCRTAF